MKTTKNIARLAVAAGLTAALSFSGVMAPVTVAFAEGTPVATTSGNVTIKDDDYAGTTFKGIKIFSATVTQGQTSADVWDSSGEKTLSDIAWASDDVKDAVMGVFTDDDNRPTSDDAQTWAEFIKEQAGSDNVGKGANVNADNKLNVIAAKLVSTEGLAWTDLTNNETKKLDAGYWLFVTKQPGSTKETNPTNGNIDAYTSPIFAIVGGEDVNAKPKKDVPNVTKAVKDDAQGSTYGIFENPNKAADSQMDDYVDYLLTGTVAGNINTYSTYKYTFTDKLPKSMTPKFKDGSTTPDVTVKIGDTEVKTGCYTAKYENDTITVDFTNLKNCTGVDDAPIALNSDSKVTVEYKAKLDSTKIFVDGKIDKKFDGLVGKPQKNTVTLTYSNNPHVDGTGTTVEHPAYDYTYGIDVTKVGSDNETKGLEGVEFTLQEQGDTSNYIKADGTKTTNSEQAKLKTDASGKINVVGLDEGTYVLKEVTPAPGYNNSAKDGVTFTIKRTLNQTGQDVTPSGSTIDAGKDVVKGGTATAEVGKLSFTIVDKKGSSLPLTGLNGVTFTWIAGGAVLCIGVAHLIRSRKRDEGSEE